VRIYYEKGVYPNKNYLETKPLKQRL